MSRRVYYIGIGWDPLQADIRPNAVDSVLNSLGDWIRLNDRTWFCSTVHSSEQLYEAIHGALPILNRIVILAVDPSERFGLAPAWLWQWLDSQQRDQPLDAARIVAGTQAAYTAAAFGPVGGPVSEMNWRKIKD